MTQWGLGPASLTGNHSVVVRTFLNVIHVAQDETQMIKGM